MKIKVINPFGGTEAYAKRQFERVKRDDVEFDLENIAEYYPLKNNQWLYFYRTCADGTIEKALKAQQDGFDAVVLSCNSDIALYDLRSLLDIPVTSSLEAAAINCHLVGYQYSFITVDWQTAQRQFQILEHYGLTKRLASYRAIGWDASNLYLDRTPEQEILDRAIEGARECLEKDHAEVIIPGCTLFESVMIEHAEECEKRIGAPIVSGMMMAFKLAESLVDLKTKCGLSNVSRVGQFQKPPREHWVTLREHMGRPLYR